MKQLNVRIEEDKLTKFKIKLLKDNLSAQEFINIIIDKYLQNELKLPISKT